MQSNKTFIILLTIIIAIIMGLSFYYFTNINDDTPFTKNSFGTSNKANKVSNNTQSTENKTSSDSSSTGSKVTFDERTTLILVSDYQEFFNVNTAINEYYKQVINTENNALLKILDSNFIVNHKLNESNVTNYIKSNYQDITFISKTMYAKGKNNVMYYFVKGEEELYSLSEETLTELENINYLVIVDGNNGAFSITPLTVSSLFDYAQNYRILDSKKISVNNYNAYTTSSYSDELVSVYYLNYFKNLLYLNTEKAYGMLDNTYKQNFIDYEDFVNHIDEIYDNLSTNILSYSATGENGKRKYSVIGTNEQRVDFNETSIMNFIVTIKQSY